MLIMNYTINGTWIEDISFSSELILSVLSHEKCMFYIIVTELTTSNLVIIDIYVIV